MYEYIDAIKEYLSDAENRVVLGCILVGLGGGLVASAYVRVHENSKLKKER